MGSALSTFLIFGCGVVMWSACVAKPPLRGPSGPTERDVLSLWNEQARVGAVRETVHGVDVDDPYRALEIDDEATQRWIRAQTRRTEWALSQVELPGTEPRLKALLSIGVLDNPVLGGDRLFFMRREGDRERSAIHVRTRDGVERAVVTPEEWGERAAIDWFYPSTDGKRVAFGVSDSGDERAVLHVRDVDSGETTDRIERAKWSSVSWLHDGSGFYYTRYPAPGEPNYDAQEPESYYPRLFFHRLGSDPAGDPLVWGAPAPTDFPSLSVSDDDRYLLIHNFRGWTASDVYLFDRGPTSNARVLAPDATHTLRTVIAGVDALTDARVHRGHVYLRTNLDAPRGRIARVAIEQAEDTTRWQTVVPEGDGPIEDWSLTRDALAVHRIVNVSSTLELLTLTGSQSRRVHLPAIGALDGLDADAQGNRVVFGFSSFFVPPAIYEVDDDAVHAAEPVVRVAADLDATRYVLDQETVTSADGTPVNLYVMRDKRLIRDGNNPVLLYGYGGFNVSLLPSFSRSALYWLERGGIYAVANIRGGGEHGEQWHRAGMLHDKRHVFEDFEAAIAWMSTSKWSRPGRIAIQGGSNGGLLMGAMLTRVPQTFAAAIASVGLYDMVRYTKFPPAALWISEYGDPSRSEDLVTLHGYSPYHQVQMGTAYPFALIETADHDTRVHWAHSTKFTARLQEAALDPTKVYFYMEKHLGHGRGTSLRDQVRRQLRTQAFLTRALGM